MRNGVDAPMAHQALRDRKRARTGPAAARKFRKLIRSWLAEDPGYDERVWPTLKRVIEENRLSSRKRFDD